MFTNASPVSDSPSNSHGSYDDNPLEHLVFYHNDWTSLQREKKIDENGKNLKALAMVVSRQDKEYFLRCPCILDGFGNNVGAIYLDASKCQTPDGNAINVGDWLQVRAKIYEKKEAEEITHEVFKVGYTICFELNSIQILEFVPAATTWARLEIYQKMILNFIEITLVFVLPTALKERLDEHECILESQDGFQTRFPINRYDQLMVENEGRLTKLQAIAIYTRPLQGRYEWLSVQQASPIRIKIRKCDEIRR